MGEQVTVMSVATYRRPLGLLGHARIVVDVTCSRLGDLVATTSFDDTRRIWNASSGDAALAAQLHFARLGV
jgi:hypothetical protein